MIVRVRDAVERDLPEMVAIYNDVVVSTTALWNDDTVDVANRAAWLAERQGRGFPVLVAVLAGTGAVAGYASFGDFRAWDGYRHTVENSIYVRADLRGRGIGCALLPALIDRAEALGKHVMIAGIERSNDASLRLHARFGFQPGGVLREVGFKFGRWLDLVLVQRPLAGR
jgi:L-amino acid N-acyltransferase YncA